MSHEQKNRQPKQETIEQGGKVTTTTEHSDGRKDVHIEVNMLDVEAKDPATKKAKEVIENEVIPKLANAEVLAIVIHTPTKQHAQQIVKLPQVRAFAQACVKSHNEQLSKRLGVAGAEAPLSEFLVVEHHITNNSVKVTTLV